MKKVLIELKNAAVMNVETTSDEVDIYVFDHDVVSEGTIAELKRYLAHADEPIEVDAVVSDVELMASREDLVAEGEAALEERRGAPDDEDEELDEAEEA